MSSKHWSLENTSRGAWTRREEAVSLLPGLGGVVPGWPRIWTQAALLQCGAGGTWTDRAWRRGDRDTGQGVQGQ